MAVALLTDIKLSIVAWSYNTDDVVLLYRMMQESFGSIIISSKGVFLSIEQSKPQLLNQSDYEKELLEALSKQRIFSDGTSFSDLDRFGNKTKIEIVF